MARPTRPRADRHAPLAVEESPQIDLREQSRVCVGCLVCGSAESRLVCSDKEMAAQRRYLTQFYRRRWRAHTAATAADRLAFTQSYTTNIVRCARCGLLYRNPRPRSGDIVGAYRSDRYEDAYLHAEFDNQRAWARNKVSALRQCFAKRPQCQAPPRVLELGSFVGGFLAEGREAGWDVYGVDPGDEVTAFCRAQGLPVFHGTLEEANLAPSSFDAVVIWNTFDQLPDPHPTLTHINRLLRNGGLLVIRVPNGACFSSAMTMTTGLPRWLRRPFDVALAWNNLLTFPYLYGYSTHTLTALTTSYGFRRAACHPDTLLPVPAGLKRWARMEERCYQWLCRASWQTVGSSGLFPSAPWLDVYFERACADEDRAGQMDTDSSLGLIPVYAPMALSHTSDNWEERCEGG